jgi:hypothetical protein
MSKEESFEDGAQEVFTLSVRKRSQQRLRSCAANQQWQ